MDLVSSGVINPDIYLFMVTEGKEEKVERHLILPYLGKTKFLVGVGDKKCSIRFVWLVVLWFSATFTAKVTSWRSVTHMCFLASHTSTNTNFFPKSPTTFLICFSRGGGGVFHIELGSKYQFIALPKESMMHILIDALN